MRFEMTLRPNQRKILLDFLNDEIKTMLNILDVGRPQSIHHVINGLLQMQYEVEDIFHEGNIIITTFKHEYNGNELKAILNFNDETYFLTKVN